MYTASKVSSEFLCFDIDGDIDPMFKVIYLSLDISDVAIKSDFYFVCVSRKYMDTNWPSLTGYTQCAGMENLNVFNIKYQTAQPIPNLN